MKWLYLFYHIIVPTRYQPPSPLSLSSILKQNNLRKRDRRQPQHTKSLFVPLLKTISKEPKRGISHFGSSSSPSPRIPSSLAIMRKLCPNYDNENALDTVLEVPIPEEMFVSMGNTAQLRWNNLRALMKAQALTDKIHLASTSNSEFVALIKIVGAPLVPFQVLSGAGYSFRSLKDCSIVSDIFIWIITVLSFNWK